MHTVTHVLIALAIVGALVTILIAALAVKNAGHYLRRHKWYRIAYRALLTGRHWDGVVRTEDKTWFHDATRALRASRYHPQSKLTWWTRACYAKRTGAAWLALLSVTGLPAGLVAAFWPTIMITGFAAAAAVMGAARKAGAWFYARCPDHLTTRPVAGLRAIRRHHATTERAIAAAVAKPLAVDASVAARGIRIHPGYEKLGPGRRFGDVALPASFAHQARDRAGIEETCRAKLAVADPEFIWRPHRLDMVTGAAPPPDIVLLRHYGGAMAELEKGKYFVAIGGSADGAFYHDPLIDEPHIAFCARTMAGKTNCVCCICAQALRRGEEVWAVDPKIVSLEHFRFVPGFRLANDPDDVAAMAQLIISFHDAYADVKRRRRYDVHRLLVLEEINMLNKMLDIWWGRAGNGKRKDNPAVIALENVLNGGAQFNHRVFVTGQELTQKAMWDLRHRFGTIFMARYDENVWRYILPGIPVREQPAHPGRMYLARNGIASLVQVPVAWPGARPRDRAYNNELWTRFALGDRDPVITPAPSQPPRPPRERIPLDTGERLDPFAQGIANYPAVLTGYAQGAAYCGMNVEAFKKARSRMPGRKIPNEIRSFDGKSPAWHREDLERWRWGVAWVPHGIDGRPARVDSQGGQRG
jgi:hypothetical protein